MIRVPGSKTQSRILIALLTIFIVRVWGFPLFSSFWVDEGVTAMVVHFPHHPSFGIAPQVTQSIYYWLPRLMGWLIGDVSGGSMPARPLEVAYRIPSMVAMAITLYLVSKLAARLIHPASGWFAVFACLSLTIISYAAVDARPYALGLCVATAGVFFLVRWCDRARRLDALLFIICGALLWRVHLVYWPFYLVFAIYVAARLAWRDTPVRPVDALIAFIAMGLTLIPVVSRALSLESNAAAHTVTTPPSLHIFDHQLRWSLVLFAGAGAWVCSRIFRWPRLAMRHIAASEKWRADSASSIVLVLAWWLVTPVAIFIYSRATGNSLFIPRYLSLLLPGVALAATFVAWRWIPADKWKCAGIGVAIVSLVMQGQWSTWTVWHERSDWRAASAEVNRFAADGRTHVLCISPFIEARSPAWSPYYELPGFLFAHIYPYPVHSIIDPFPFVKADGMAFAERLAREVLPATRQFAIYGVYVNTEYWRDWFAQQPEFAGWKIKTIAWGYVQAVEFTR